MEDGFEDMKLKIGFLVPQLKFLVYPDIDPFLASFSKH
jgi:hypothetical protein